MKYVVVAVVTATYFANCYPCYASVTTLVIAVVGIAIVVNFVLATRQSAS